MKWSSLEVGGGTVEVIDTNAVQLSIPARPHGYTDAQIDDTSGLARKTFVWRPPARLELEARVSPEAPQGTFGFGFWNDPFSFSLGMQGAARRLPVPPQAIWFFYGSPPNDIQLTPMGGNAGWKAMSLRSPRLPGLVTLPLAAIGVGLAQLRASRHLIMRATQQAVRVHERLLSHNIEQWHKYRIDWEAEIARFYVDDDEVLQAPYPSSSPLGFVAWIDNQYAVASPDGGFRFGVIPSRVAQTLQLKGLKIGKV